MCLIATIIIYLATKELRVRRPTPILANICFNLALGYIIFIIGMDGRAKRFSDPACYACAISMHIAFLCSWFWMLIYSLNMYFALVKVVGSNALVSKKQFMYVFGYVVPVIIVAIDLGVSFVLDNHPKGIEAANFESHYIASHVCWLRNMSMYLGFALPIGIILLVNIALFFVIIRKLTWKRDEVRSSKQTMDIQQRVVMAITMITMMGLTWIFGYVMLISDDKTFQDIMSIIFDIFNTCQGVVIFWVSCVRQKGVRNLWVRPIMKRCGITKAGNENFQSLDESRITSNSAVSATKQKSSTVM